jgi:hypothetical protein
MMGGYGPGMMGYGPGYYGNQGDLKLTTDQVKNYLEQMIRNPNLKVGDVKEKDADTIVALVVWLVRSLAGPSAQHMPPRRSAGLDVLEERYARGEISRDEYLETKRDLG